MGKRDDYVSAMKDAFISVGTNAAFVAISGAAPWAKLPIINVVIKFILKRILSFVVNSGETSAFFLYIDTRVNAQATEFENAAMKNREAQLHGSEEEKRIAEANLINKFIAFARISS
jgi:hypothetical protein